MAKGTTMVLDEKSLHCGTYEELAKLDKFYASYFN
jgi:hypothetical protein